MYHRSLNVYIVNQKEEVNDTIRNYEYPKNLEVIHFIDEKLNTRKLSKADVCIYDVSGKNLQDVMETFNKNKGDGAIAIICVERSKLALLAKLFDLKQYYNIWPSEMEVDEFLYYYNRLIEQIMLENEHWLVSNYLDAVINSVPDLIWFKDKVGAHLKVNQSFCQAVGKTSEQIEGRGHYYIWNISPDEYAKGEFICMESEYEVMDRKETCIFDEDVLIKKELRKLKTYKSPLFDFDGTVMGTVGVAKDVTDELRYKALWEENTSKDPVTGSLTKKALIEELNDKSDALAIYYVGIKGIPAAMEAHGYEILDSMLIRGVEVLYEMLEGTSFLISRVNGYELAIARYGSFMAAELKSSAGILADALNEGFAGIGVTEARAVVGYAKTANIQGQAEEVLEQAAKMMYEA